MSLILQIVEQGSSEQSDSHVTLVVSKDQEDLTKTKQMKLIERNASYIALKPYGLIFLAAVKELQLSPSIRV